MSSQNKVEFTSARGNLFALSLKKFPVTPFDYGAFGDGTSHTISSGDITSNISSGAWLGRVARTFADGVINGTTTMTSSTANFVSGSGGDVGAPVFGTGIPPNTWIKVVTNSTTVTLSSSATASGSGVTIKLGGYESGDQWDYVALQEAIWHVYGGPTTTQSHNNANSWKNYSSVYIPGGKYLVNKTVYGVGVTGFHIIGDGKNASQIHNNDSSGNYGSLFYFDGLAYGRIEGIGLYQDTTNLTLASGGEPIYAMMEIDWTGIYATLAPQQITVADFAFFGNSKTNVGLRIARSGGGAQGDTVLLSNNFWGNFKYAGLEIGQGNSAFNALSIIVHGGNIQGCLPYGIKNSGGSIFVDGTSFQCLGAGRTQVAVAGADYFQSSSPGTSSVMRNIRSEDLVLSNGCAIIENSGVQPSEFSSWAATHAYSQGATVRALAGGNDDGRVFTVTSAGGTTSGTEPVWSTVALGGFGTVTIASGSALPTLVTTATGSATKHIGDAVIIAGAGVAGADLFAHITATSPFTLDTTASTNVTAAVIQWGTETTDGTVLWMHLDYAVASNFTTCTGSLLPFGRVQTNPSNKITISDNTFSRADYWSTANFFATGTNSTIQRNCVIHSAPSGPTTGGANVATESFGGSTFKSTFNVSLQPILWRSGSSSLFPDIGLLRTGGSISAIGTAAGDTNNVLAVVGTLGAPVASGTDAAGTNLLIQGGAGTGAGGGGKISLRTQSAGSTGTAVGNATEAMAIDNLQRVKINEVMNLVPQAFSSAIATPAEGDIAYFNNSTTATHAATITGGGSNHVVGLYNGTNWVVLYP